MFGNHFYHERIRRSIGAFGSLFNNINILRKQGSGNVASQVKVPLSFAPKRKFLDEIRQRNSSNLHDEQVIAVTLPRMSFEMVGLNYDPSRQLPKTNNRIKAGSSPSVRNRFYTKTPYNIQFQLNLYTKNHDEALQVLEQIFPYFTPQYTLSMKPMDDFPDIIDDIPLVLNAVTFSDDYEGPAEQRRTIIYTLDFEMKIDFYGPTTESKVIEKADIEFFLNSIRDSNIEVYTSYSTLSVTTDPRPVSPDSDFDDVTTLSLTRDSGAI